MQGNNIPFPLATVQRYLRQKLKEKKRMGKAKGRSSIESFCHYLTTRMGGWLHPDVTDEHKQAEYTGLV
jgi:hypothetical protein